MEKAKAVVDEYVRVTVAYRMDSDWVLETRCPTYDDFPTLPKVVEYRDRLYGLTGWNSDLGSAYYKTSAQLAKIVK